MILPARRRSAFSPPPTRLQRQAVPIVSTMVASLAPLLPVVFVEPVLPPFGLIMFLGWRLLRADIWPLWAGLPLGLWDDLYSGQPLGTAMCGWTAIMLALEVLERRTGSRDHRRDWGIATAAIAAHQLFALLIADGTGGATSPLLLVPQLAVSAAFYPLAYRACAALERWRNPVTGKRR